MPRRRKVGRATRDALDYWQWLELLLGPRSENPAQNAFPNDGDRRAAWRLHGAGMIAEIDRRDPAPWALREYGAPDGR